jgi:aspartyl-tRNA(Asn)/glutamyl-tRNA(Gln) amidotransferase subunit A
VLRDAGWVLEGKTNLHEVAYGTTSRNPHFGTVRNPLDERRLAGGSSSGSAAALVTGEADAALGTDSGGSIRIPAACCGVAGFKPTHGLVPIDGVLPLAPSFDHVGPLAPTAAGCAAVMRDLVPGLAVPVVDLEALRCAVVWADHACAGIAAGVRAAAERFGEITTVPFPEPGALSDRAAFRHEAWLVHRDLLARHRDRYGEDVVRKLDRGARTTREEYVEAMAAAVADRAALAQAFAAADLLLTTTLPTVAPALEAREIGGVNVNDALTTFTLPFNVLGWPAAAVPTGPAEDGLPGSVQIVGPPGSDGVVLGAAIALERALGAAPPPSPSR